MLDKTLATIFRPIPLESKISLPTPKGQIRKLNAGSNKALTPPEALTPTLVPLTKDLFTKFMKAFVESTQAWNREQAEPQKQLLKAKSPETYSKKSHINCYHFY